MPLFLTIFEGPTPLKARPILATRDPDIIATVRQLLMARLEGKPAGKVGPLRPRKGKEEGRDE